MPNRFLTGAYEPATEERTIADLAVTGALPAWLDGRYLRNGPNPIGLEPDDETYFWVMGAAMLHGVRLRDGRAEWYRNRWLRTAATSATLGDVWPGGPIHAGSDGANTNVIGHAGRTLAIVEAGAVPYEVDADLNTIGPTDFGGTLPNGYTAHPKLDPRTGELHAVSYHWGWTDKVQYTAVGPEGRVTRVVDVPLDGSPMIHDCAITESSVLVYDLPFRLDFAQLGKGGGLPYGWFGDSPSRIGVLPRHGSDEIQWFELDPCYVFHTFNAYDDGDEIVVDVIRMPSLYAGGDGIACAELSAVHRWTLDRSSGKAREDRLDDRPQEFPRINETLTGRRHRFGWSALLGSDADDVVDFDGTTLCKHDFVADDVRTRSFGSATSVGEFVHVPSPDATAEDDGVVMGFVYDLGGGATDLVVLDSATLEDVARVHLPCRVPYGFHGNWLPEQP